MLFIPFYQLLSFSRRLNFYLNSFVMQKKWLDLKDKVNFNIYEIAKEMRQNETAKFGQVMEYNKSIFLQKSRRKSCRETSSRPFLFFKKVLHRVKSSDLQLSFNIFQYSSTWHTIKENSIKLRTIHPEDFNFDLLEKGLGIVSPSLFMFLCYILLTD